MHCGLLLQAVSSSFLRRHYLRCHLPHVSLAPEVEARTLCSSLKYEHGLVPLDCLPHRAYQRCIAPAVQYVQVDGARSMHGYPDMHQPSCQMQRRLHLRLQHQRPADCNFISRPPAKRALAQARRLRRARPIQSIRFDSARLDLT